MSLFMRDETDEPDEPDEPDETSSQQSQQTVFNQVDDSAGCKFFSGGSTERINKVGATWMAARRQKQARDQSRCTR
jgi:hypothetical protein